MAYHEIYAPIVGAALDALPSPVLEEVRPGRKLSIVEAGAVLENAAMSVVFVHGSMATWRQGAPLLATLAASPSVQVVSWDAFGCGESPKPERWADYATSELLADAVAIVEGKCGTSEVRRRPLVLMGHSFGCSLVVRLAQRVQAVGLVLLCPAAVGMSLGFAKTLFRLPLFLLNRMKAQLSEGFVSGGIASTSPDSLRDVCRKHNRRGPMHVCKAFYRQLEECPADTAQALALPMLVVAGVQDQITPAAQVADLVTMLRATRSADGACVREAVVPDASHMLMLEQPEQLETLVRDFFASDCQLTIA